MVNLIDRDYLADQNNDYTGTGSSGRNDSNNTPARHVEEGEETMNGKNDLRAKIERYMEENPDEAVRAGMDWLVFSGAGWEVIF